MPAARLTYMNATGGEEFQTRYAKQQEKQYQQQRHATIVQKLSKGIVEEFEEALARSEPPPCVLAGLPSEWTDWDGVPDHREPQDGKMPTALRASEMCSGCPLMEGDVCYRYALATNKQHGIWGGRRFQNGIVVSNGREAPDTPNRERYQ